jgi:two-component system NtrC family sensor kinase
VLRDFKYHYKIPLSLTLVIAVTALVVSATLTLLAYQNAKRELISNALGLGKVLSRTLLPAMLHDEPWQAYEIVATPLEIRTERGAAERVIVVLDAKNQVYVSSSPMRFPMLERLGAVDPEFGVIEKRVAGQSNDEAFTAEESDWQYIHVVVPILAEDGARLGTLIVASSHSLFLPQFYAALGGVALSTLTVLVVLLPIGWYWGRRMAEPLEYLAESMAKVGREPIEELRRGLPRSGDEVGMLGKGFDRMLQELEEKKAMEKQMLASERLAAIGRLTAGISHEINNPLGGMLNAISTYKKHGSGDALTMKTLSLLERGLLQIRETVGALLVEARLESHALTAQDIEDARTLVTPEAQKKGAQLVWSNEIAEPLPLPSTQVRQILLNLLLNAVAATEHRGRLECSVSRVNGSLRMSIANDGRQISRERLDHLYEPFAAQGEAAVGGSGIGLWVTYQLVQQLNGRIDTDSRPGGTTFTVELPIDT